MIELHNNFKGVFGRIEFKEDEKLWRENGRKNIFEVCLVGWRGRGKKNGETYVFFPWFYQKVFSQNREKTGGEIICGCAPRLTEMPMCTCTWSLSMPKSFLSLSSLSPSCFFFFFSCPLAHTQLFLLKTLCYFFVCTYTIFLLKNVLFFVLFNGDIIVNLYKLYFSIFYFF